MDDRNGAEVLWWCHGDAGAGAGPYQRQGHAGRPAVTVMVKRRGIDVNTPNVARIYD
jgi:hypothetical protein